MAEPNMTIPPVIANSLMSLNSADILFFETLHGDSDFVSKRGRKAMSIVVNSLATHISSSGQHLGMEVPGFLMDIPSDDEDSHLAKSYEDSQLPEDKRSFWHATEKLYENSIQDAPTSQQSPSEEDDLDRTKINLSDSVGFIPLRIKSAASSSYYPSHDTDTHLIFYELLNILESSGLVQYHMGNSLLPKDRTLFGGSDGVADGASYRVSTRFTQIGRQKKLVAIKTVKGSLFEPYSSSFADYNMTRMHTIRRDVSVMASPLYKGIGGHPNILGCMGYGWQMHDNENMSIFLVVPWAQYGTLREYLRNRQLDPITKVRIFEGICHGLRSLHDQEICHGDIKLDNVLVFKRRHLDSEAGRHNYQIARQRYPTTPDIDENVNVRLSDFGSSITSHDDTYFGTTIYNAPELRSGLISDVCGSNNDIQYKKCDIYPLGLLLLEMLQDGRRIDSSCDPKYVRIGDRDEWGPIRAAEQLLEQIRSLPDVHVRITHDLALLWKDIFSNTLNPQANERLPIKGLINIIDGWRRRLRQGALPQSEVELKTGSDPQSYDLINQKPHLSTRSMFKAADTSLSAKVDGTARGLARAPRSVMSKIYASWYKIAIETTGTASKIAAMSILDTSMQKSWTKITTVEEFLHLLDIFVSKCQLIPAIFLYYRLRYATTELPRVESPWQLESGSTVQTIDEFERSVLDEHPTIEDYEYLRFVFYRNLMRSDRETSIRQILTSEDEDVLSGAQEIPKPKWQIFDLCVECDSTLILFHLVYIGDSHGLLVALERQSDTLKSNVSLLRQLVRECCKLGRLDMLKVLLADVCLDYSDATEQESQTPLHQLCMFDRQEVAEATALLIRKGCDVNAELDIHFAIHYDWLPHCKFWGSPLSIAVNHNRIDVVHLLLDHGASLKTGNYLRSSPINIAARCNYVDILKLLCSKLDTIGDVEFSPLRTLSHGVPFDQELRNGRSSKSRLYETVKILRLCGFDVNEQKEILPRGNYNEQYNVLSRLLRDCDFTTGFDVLDALLDNGFSGDLSLEDLIDCLMQHHESIQIRLTKYLIAKNLLVEQCNLKQFKANLISNDLSGVLKLVLDQMSESETRQIEDRQSEMRSLINFAMSIDASPEIISILLDSEPDIYASELAAGFAFGRIVITGQPKLLDLFLDKGVKLSAEHLESFCADQRFEFNGDHIIRRLVRFADGEGDDGARYYRHPQVVRLLLQPTEQDSCLYFDLLRTSILYSNLGALTALFGMGLLLPQSIFYEVVVLLTEQAIVVCCLQQQTQNKYLQKYGYQNHRQFQVKLWTLSFQWSVLQDDAEDSVRLGCLTWAVMMHSPELVAELLLDDKEALESEWLVLELLKWIRLPFAEKEEEDEEGDHTSGKQDLYTRLIQLEYFLATEEQNETDRSLAIDEENLLARCHSNAILGRFAFNRRHNEIIQLIVYHGLCASDTEEWIEFSRTLLHISAERLDEIQYNEAWLRTILVGENL